MGYSFHDPLQQVLSDLDKCPKPIKIASSRVRVWGSTPDFRRNPAVTGRGHPGLPVRCRPGAGCGKRLFRAKGRCGSGAGLVSAGVPPALSRLHCPPSPWAMAGRAVRAVRGRCGRLRAALWRLRDALSGSTGNGFVSGALLPLVALRRFGVSQWFASGATCRPSRIVALCRAAMRRYAPVRGDPPHWLAMARYDTPGVRRFTSPSPAGGVTRPDMARILPGRSPSVSSPPLPAVLDRLLEGLPA